MSEPPKVGQSNLESPPTATSPASTPAEPSTPQQRRLVLWLTNASHGMNHFQLMMVSGLYPLIMRNLGFGPIQLGQISAVRHLFNWTQGGYGFITPFIARPIVLVGSLTARSLVFNAVLPALALLARAEKDDRLNGAVEKLHAIFPMLQRNHVTHFMAHRLFGEGGGKKLINTERRQQGLFQIFYACCSGEEHDCDDDT